MPRQRFIWPDLWDDLDVAALSRDERLLFIGLFSLADDEGRIQADPRYLKGQIFKYDDNLTVEQVRAMRDRVASTLKNVHLYQIDGKDYIQLRQWSRWQRPRYPQPSRIPPPPNDNAAPPHATSAELPDPACVKIDAMMQQSHDKPAAALPPGLGRDEMGREEIARAPSRGNGDAALEIRRAEEVHPDAAEVAAAYLERFRPSKRRPKHQLVQRSDWALADFDEALRSGVTKAVLLQAIQEAPPASLPRDIVRLAREFWVRQQKATGPPPDDGEDIVNFDPGPDEEAA